MKKFETTQGNPGLPLKSISQHQENPGENPISQKKSPNCPKINPNKLENLHIIPR